MENKDTTTKEKNTPVMRKFTDTKDSSAPIKILAIFLLVAIVGVGTGYALSRYTAKASKNVATKTIVKGGGLGKSFGSDDTKTFKDTVDGELKEGGIEGEGQFHLVRPGGDSQNVYLTSANVDLAQFVGKKIKVWGQTQTAQKAGWLMDVGRVEVE